MRSLLFVLLFAFVVNLPLPAQQAPPAAPAAPAGPGLTITTAAWPDGDDIPLKYTQAGEQASPQLAWANAPMGTQSYVLHMHDMEGARNKTTEDQLHWLVWNIPAETRALPEGVPMGDLKDGSHQTSATGNGVYRGPGAPANGPYHHYVFEIFALDTKIDIPANPTDPFDTRAKVLAAMQGHVLGKAVYLGFFRRPS